ncbi:MAG: sigma-70 family RNA polymerase sigma factor [Microbacteriaceae bacterium]|nr:sigma-70 family RNA polymerase sigma factor [Microbacteriaceae bacterium]
MSGSAPLPSNRPQGTAREKDEGPFERPRYWGAKTRSNHWAHADELDIGRYPKVKPLSYLQEAKLVQQAQAGDVDVRNRLWRLHLRLAFSVANRFRIEPHDLPDAVQEAAMGLLPAIMRFEVQRYNSFSTYAWHWLAQRLHRFLMKNGYAVRAPSNLHRAYQVFCRGLSRCRSAADWFDWRDDWLSTDPGLYDRLLHLHSVAHPGPLQDAAELPCSMPHPIAALCRAELRTRVREAVSRLPDRERDIIVRRYGMGTGEPETLETIACGLRVSKERTRQLQHKAEVRLRRWLRNELDEPRPADTPDSTAPAKNADPSEVNLPPAHPNATNET